MRKILTILPFKVADATRVAHEQTLQRDAMARGTLVSCVGLEDGPTPADFSQPGFQHAVPSIVEIARRQQDDYDGILISCFEDPGLAEVREMSRIPVVGPCQTALQLALLGGEDFFIVSPDRESEPLYRELAAEAGVADRFVSFVHLPFEIEGVSDDPALPRKVADAIARARKTTHASTAILGCTAFTDCYDAIRELAGGRVIEPARAAIRILEVLIDLGSRGESAQS
jgi:allantoin racemase